MPTLSVVIPCYNEALTIETIVDAVSKSEIEDLEILVVDDYSTDGTRDKLREIQEKRSIEVVHHERNMGKGAALRTGFARATGDIYLCLLFIHPPAHGSEVSPAARNTLDSARIPRASKLLICGLFLKGRVLAQDEVRAWEGGSYGSSALSESAGSEGA